jgi:hypothetical protein
VPASAGRLTRTLGFTLRPTPPSTILAVALAVQFCILPSSAAQRMPVAPVVLRIEARAAEPSGTEWQIGPLQLSLPSTWKNASQRSVVVLKDSSGATAAFVALEVTPEARGSGYSVLSDAARGPDTFERSVSWDECQGADSRRLQPFELAQGQTARVATCSAGPGQIYAQVSLYSREHLVQILAIGPTPAVERLIAAIRAAKLGE